MCECVLIAPIMCKWVTHSDLSSQPHIHPNMTPLVIQITADPVRPNLSRTTTDRPTDRIDPFTLLNIKVLHNVIEQPFCLNGSIENN